VHFTVVDLYYFHCKCLWVLTIVVSTNLLKWVCHCYTNTR